MESPEGSACDVEGRCALCGSDAVRDASAVRLGGGDEWLEYEGAKGFGRRGGAGQQQLGLASTELASCRRRVVGVRTAAALRCSSDESTTSSKPRNSMNGSSVVVTTLKRGHQYPDIPRIRYHECARCHGDEGSHGHVRTTCPSLERPVYTCVSTHDASKRHTGTYR